MLGGVSAAVETLRGSLERLGHRVVVVAPRMPGTPAREDGVIRVPAVPAPTYPDFALPLPLAPALARRLQALDLDVFHAQHPFLLGASARRLARAAGRPLVFTHHTLYDRYAHYVPLPRPLVRWGAVRWSTRFANGADLVVVPSAALRERLRAQGVRRPIEVVPTGTEPARFHPGDRRAARDALGLPASARLLLYVGRLDREKNLEFLLEAFAAVAARVAGAEFLLVGRGMREAALREVAARRGIGARVRFAGGVPREAVVRYYQAADVFVFASTTETQGLAVLEAMSVGVPVVAVRASGVEEAVVDGVTGLLVPEHPGTFAAAVQLVLTDPDLAAKLAGGAREAVLRLTADAQAARLATLYRRLRAGRTGR